MEMTPFSSPPIPRSLTFFLLFRCSSSSSSAWHPHRSRLFSFPERQTRLGSESAKPAVSAGCVVRVHSLPERRRRSEGLSCQVSLHTGVPALSLCGCSEQEEEKPLHSNEAAEVPWCPRFRLSVKPSTSSNRRTREQRERETEKNGERWKDSKDIAEFVRTPLFARC